MRSLVLKTPEQFEWINIEAPKPLANEALVKVMACGVCGTDLHAYRGKQPFFSYPRRLGHELAVEILSAPQESGLVVGDRCAVEPYFFCGECPACNAGKTNCCHKLRVMGVHVDGGHTEQLAVPWKHLHKSNKLSNDQLAMVEPLAIGAHAIERASLKKDEPVVILGMGPIGLTVAMFAKAAGANVAIVDLDKNRLQLASDTMKLGSAIQGGDGVEERLKAHFGQFPNCVIDATGSPHSMNKCFNFTEHGGRVVFVGLFIGDLQFDDPNFHRRELSLHASRAALSETFRDVIRKIESGDVNPISMITHRLNFEDLQSGFSNLFHAKGLIKAVIDY